MKTRNFQGIPAFQAKPASAVLMRPTPLNGLTHWIMIKANPYRIMYVKGVEDIIIKHLWRVEELMQLIINSFVNKE
jgi:hypothetical protein